MADVLFFSIYWEPGRGAKSYELFTGLASCMNLSWVVLS